MLIIGKVFAGWLQKEKIRTTFERLKHQLLGNKEVITNLLLYLNITVENIEDFHHRYFAEWLNDADHPLRKHFAAESPERLHSDFE